MIIYNIVEKKLQGGNSRLFDEKTSHPAAKDGILYQMTAKGGGEMDRIDRAYVKKLLPARDPYGHKGTFGKVLCICGSVGYTGAPVFASRAAVRTGSGLVFLAVPESIWPVCAVKSDEAMPFPMPDMDGRLHGCFTQLRQRAEGCDAILAGCGLGRSAGLDELVRDILTFPQPLVLEQGSYR